MKGNNGIFLISLDFELYWGLIGLRSFEKYKKAIQGVWNAIPSILKLFKKYNIHATWAIVGFVFFKNWEELKSNLPPVIPNYQRRYLSPYNYLKYIKNPLKLIHYFFAPNLIERIQKTAHQDICSHTFSHYYCLEKDQDEKSFREDLIANIEIAKKNNINLNSIIFPKNQFNGNYLNILKNFGIEAYRINSTKWLYNDTNINLINRFKKFIRLIDVYLNLTGHNTFSLDSIIKIAPYKIPTSKFLYPSISRIKKFEFLRLKRIKADLLYAAKNKEIFHLWWHPYNFGLKTKKNLEFLEKLLIYYTYLNKKYGIKSYSFYDMIKILKN